ncbi:hypothetical protein [Nostoc sp.]|uniref:hypothetical protein n=1 Tax=Nostoc sp. TaxID=1180 RepID=UPI002FF5AA68
MITLTANCVRHSGQEDHQTEVLRQELIDGYGLLPQQILREAIADYHAKIKSQEKEQSQKETAESEVVVSRGCFHKWKHPQQRAKKL